MSNHKPSEIAQQDQGDKANVYAGVDNWRDMSPKVGQTLVQFDYRDKGVIEKKNDVASQYFTTKEVLDKAGRLEDGRVDGRALGEAVQVGPYRNFATKKFEYSQNVVTYEVLKPIPASAYAKVENNLILGKGKAEQYFLNMSKSDLIKDGYLQRQEILEVGNREHKNQLYQKFEKNNTEDKKIPVEVHSHHQDLKAQMWERNIGNDRERVATMDRLENESCQLRGEPLRNQPRTVEKAQLKEKVPELKREQECELSR